MAQRGRAHLKAEEPLAGGAFRPQGHLGVSHLLREFTVEPLQLRRLAFPFAFEKVEFQPALLVEAKVVVRLTAMDLPARMAVGILHQRLEEDLFVQRLHHHIEPHPLIPVGDDFVISTLPEAGGTSVQRLRTRRITLAWFPKPRKHRTIRRADGQTRQGKGMIQEGPMTRPPRLVIFQIRRVHWAIQPWDLHVGAGFAQAEGVGDGAPEEEDAVLGAEGEDGGLADGLQPLGRPVVRHQDRPSLPTEKAMQLLEIGVQILARLFGGSVLVGPAQDVHQIAVARTILLLRLGVEVHVGRAEVDEARFGVGVAAVGDEEHIRKAHPKQVDGDVAGAPREQRRSRGCLIGEARIILLPRLPFLDGADPQFRTVETPPISRSIRPPSRQRPGQFPAPFPEILHQPVILHHQQIGIPHAAVECVLRQHIVGRGHFMKRRHPLQRLQGQPTPAQRQQPLHTLHGFMVVERLFLRLQPPLRQTLRAQKQVAQHAVLQQIVVLPPHHRQHPLTRPRLLRHRVTRLTRQPPQARRVDLLHTSQPLQLPLAPQHLAQTLEDRLKHRRQRPRQRRLQSRPRLLPLRRQHRSHRLPRQR